MKVSQCLQLAVICTGSTAHYNLENIKLRAVLNTYNLLLDKEIVNFCRIHVITFMFQAYV